MKKYFNIYKLQLLNKIVGKKNDPQNEQILVPEEDLKKSEEQKQVLSTVYLTIERLKC